MLQYSISASASGASGGDEVSEEALEEGMAGAAIDNPYNASLQGEGLLFILRIFQETIVVSNEK